VAERDHDVIVCEGEWDIARAEEFARRVSERPARSLTALILDFRPATFVDASTVGAICRLARAASESGVGVAVACRAGHVRRVFELVHLADLVPVAETVEDALQAARGSATT
jgi:anti-sigma B factor antagonist